MSKFCSEVLKSTFDRALAWPIAHTGFRGLTFAAAMAASKDFHPIAKARLLPLFDARKEVLAYIKLCEKIDQAVDTCDPAIVSAADFSRDEKGICRFLYDERFVSSDCIRLLHALDEKNVIDFDLSTQYANLCCDFIQERALQQVEISKTLNPSKRQSMVSENLNFCALFGCFFFGLAQPATAELKNGVSYQAVSASYPEIYTINFAGQILDDLRDIAIDLEDEVLTGHISPNAALSHALKSPADYHELYGFYASHGANTQTFRPENFPVALRNGVLQLQDQFFEAIAPVKSIISRNILESFWRNTLREGIHTSFHPLVHAKLEAKAY